MTIPNEGDEWTCAGCGMSSPDKVRCCDCPTNVVIKNRKQDWKVENIASIRNEIAMYICRKFICGLVGGNSEDCGDCAPGGISLDHADAILALLRPGNAHSEGS